MVNYHNGKIYRIDCLTTGKVYIGSTTKETVAHRLAEHVSKFKQWKAGKSNYTSFQIIEQGNYKITLIELYPCNSKDELSRREGFYIRSMECVNKVIPNRTKEEWIERNKEQILEKRQVYNKEHKEMISERQKGWYESNKEVIIERSKIHYEDHKEIILEQHKIYRDENREKIRERDRKFYKENKDRISEKRKTPYTCLCGKTTCINEKISHEKSAFHMKNILII